MKPGTILVLSLFGTFLAIGTISASAGEWLALALMIVAGVPHGSFDLRVARRKWGSGALSQRRVVVLYVMSVVAMSSLCVFVPPVGLALFLALSALHFSEGEGRERCGGGSVRGWLFGVGAIALPIAWHLDQASLYMGYFLNPKTVNDFAPGAHGVVLTLSLIMGILIIRDVMRWREDDEQTAFQRVVCLLGWILLPPLAGFCVWFIGRHSRQHLELCREMFHGSRLGIPLDFALISVAAIMGLLPFALLFDFSDINQLFAAALSLIAGLTLPHMIVSMGMERDVTQRPAL